MGNGAFTLDCYDLLSTKALNASYFLRGLTGVAYPLSMAMREPKGWDKQIEADPTLLRM